MLAVKGGRYIARMKKLAGVETALANFFASASWPSDRPRPGARQLPPNLGYDADRLRAFFDLLPRSTTAAARLAARHDEKLSGDRVWTRPTPTVRCATPWRCGTTRSAPTRRSSCCADHDIALVVADTAGRWPLLERTTSDFMYVRLHGDEELYVSGYSPAALDSWATRIRAWADRGQDVYVYFDNDVKVHAPYDALGLMERLGLQGADAPPVTPART